MVESQSMEKSSRQLQWEISSMESLGKEDQEKVVVNDLSQMPDGEFKDHLKKYPELFEFSFKSEEPKNKIVHRSKIERRNLCP